ncbi:hypothetical protein V8G54_002849 [Vigna mungo]|uniref:Uncharacterized protein n=1 Tax=Vigna mungo TaxID=3915 RepID=A0AAQ3PBS1_VIGMU
MILTLGSLQDLAIITSLPFFLLLAPHLSLLLKLYFPPCPQHAITPFSKPFHSKNSTLLFHCIFQLQIGNNDEREIKSHTIFFSMADEGVLHPIHINIGDLSLWQFFPQFPNSFF